MSKTKHIEGIGEVLFVKSKRAKNLRISIKPFEGVKVTMPYYMTYKSSTKFLKLKKEWVVRNLKEIQTKEVTRTVFDEKSVFKTNLHTLHISRVEGEKMKSTIKSGFIIIYIPNEVEINDAEIQKFIRKSIEESWRIEAKQYLLKRTNELATKHGFKYNKISIRNTVSRWGSCSFKNNISYSLHLMRLPKQLQDYVILHELTHTIEKNHQPPFWNLLNRVTNGEAKLLDKEVKKYSTRIY